MNRLLFFMHTSSQIGGVETWLDRAHAHFAAQGFEPVVGLVRGMRYNDPARYREHHPDIRTIEVDGRGLNREGRVRALARAIRRENPAVVLPLGIVDANEAVIRCKRAGADVRLVAHAQGNLAPMLADLASYRDWIDSVVCPGRLTSRVLVDWAGFAPGRVVNIPNGADPAHAPRVARRAGQPLRVGYVGRMSKHDKRATDLIDLDRELEARGVEYTLDIVGDGPCLPEIRNALANREPRVRIHGAAKHAELYSRFFPQLDVLVMTSSSEAFGIVLVEAMMHGVVPVSSRYDGFHAEGLVRDGSNGLSFAVGDMPAAAETIARLAQDGALLDRLSAESLRLSTQYTWECSLTRWAQALRDAIALPPLRAAKAPVVPQSGGLGLLDRIGVPAELSDLVRRARRALLGPAVAAGGEEWPLFHRHHSDTMLAAVEHALKTYDVPAIAAATSMPT